MGSVSRRRSRRRRDAIVDIPLTPLIDTALTLLIIFMVTAPMIQNAIRVDLPRGAAKEDKGLEQELVVFIDKDGQLFFNGQQMADGDLITHLKEQVAGKNNEQTIFVKADQAASYGKVIELVDRIKVVGGVRYVALATQKRA